MLLLFPTIVRYREKVDAKLEIVCSAFNVSLPSLRAILLVPLQQSSQTIRLLLIERVARFSCE